MSVCKSLWERKSLPVQPTHQPKSSHHYTICIILQVNQLPADLGDVPNPYLYFTLSPSLLTLTVARRKCQLSAMQHKIMKIAKAV